ncbi:MAG: hypothetical protein WBC42_09080, partial [Candidatus Zixiibacteriota bacterium]
MLTKLTFTLWLATMSVFFSLPLRAKGASLPDSGIVKLSSTLWSDLRDVAFRDAIAYALFFDGLTVVDLSNINSPSQIGQVELPGEGLKVDISGDRACVAARDSTIYLIDISSVDQPLLAGSFKLPDLPTDIAARENCAYVSTEDSGFFVLDVSNPLDVSLIGSCDLSGFQPLSLCLRDNIAYLAGPGGLRLINVFFPYVPFLFGSSDAVSGGNKVLAAAEGGRTYAYMGNPLQLSILDVTNPRDIFPLSAYTSASAIADMVVWRNHVYLGLTYDGLMVLDINDRTSPEKVAALNLGDNTRGAFFHSGFLFVSDHFGPSKVINVFNPDRPFAAGSWIIPGTCKDVATSGDFAYVMCDHSGLHIFNVENPTQPQMAGVLQAPYNNNGVEVEGDYAFITALLTGMQVVDISDPYDPQAVQSYQPDGYTYGVTVKDGFAYLLNAGNDIQIIDVQNSLSLIPRGSVLTPGSVQEVFVAGNYLYAADRSAGLTIINAADEDNPYVVKSVPTVGNCTDVFSSDSRLFLACEGEGMQIYDLTDPETPDSLGFYSVAANVKDLYVEAEYAYLTLEDDRIEVVNIAIPSTPFLAASYGSL